MIFFKNLNGTFPKKEIENILCMYKKYPLRHSNTTRPKSQERVILKMY